MTNETLRLFQPGEQVWYWTFLSNWRSGFRIDVYPLTHVWSLAIEEQFYLTWPLAVFALTRQHLAKLCVGIFLCALAFRAVAIYGFDSGTNFAYRLTPGRMDAIGCGALVAMAIRSSEWRRAALPFCKPVLVAGLAALSLIGIVNNGFEIDKDAVIASVPSVVAVMSGAIVLLAVSDPQSMRSLNPMLHSRILRHLGKYSYALYLFHWPVHLLVARYTKVATVNGTPGIRAVTLIGHFVIAAGVSYLLARMSWVTLEAPAARLKTVLGSYASSVQ